MHRLLLAVVHHNIFNNQRNGKLELILGRGRRGGFRCRPLIGVRSLLRKDSNRCEQ
jgi:hypothetical protein